MKLGPAPRLYLIADAGPAGRPLPEVVAQAVGAGVRLVQLREKQLPDAPYLVLARELRRLTDASGARLLLNTRLEVARAVGADGVHLPRDVSIGAARRALGPRALLGVSTHSAAELRRAEDEGADFVTLSPVFAPLSKAAPGGTLGLERFGALVETTSLPVFALGGVSPANARACLAAGAYGVATVGAIMHAADVRGAVRAFLEVTGLAPLFP